MSGAAQPLALHGGAPVRATLLPYARQSVDAADVAAVTRVLRSDYLTTGPEVAAFEEEFAAHVGARYAVSFSSGTAALHGAARAAGLGPGDEAITTPMTFSATANCVLYCGARPVFADVSPDTLNLEPERVEAALTPRTRAVLAVDYAGHPAPLAELQDLAGGRSLTLIEDACHALGARYRDRPVGSIADLSVFSFHPVKHLATGEGGMVTTDRDDLAQALRRFRNHGIDRDAAARQRLDAWEYDIAELGYNYRLSDLAAALGRSQLRKQAPWLARRRELARRYQDALSEEPALTLPVTRDGMAHAWHLYPVRLDPRRIRWDRGDVFRALRAEGIGVNVHYVPVHLLSVYRQRFGTGPGDLPVAETAYSQLLSLPMFPAMSDGDQDDVIAAVRKVLAHAVRGGTRE